MRAVQPREVSVVASGARLRQASRTRASRVLTGLPSSVGDPLLVGLVALAVYALHGYDGVLNRDYGLFVYGGEQVARGVPPYLGVFNTVGPLSDALPGLAIWAGHAVGADPVLSARVLYSVIAAGCCALVAVLARDVLRSRAAAILAAALFLQFGSFLELASDGPRDKTAMLVFLLAALVLVVRRRWAAAGVATALATLTWQPAFLVAAAAAAAGALGAPSGRSRAAVAYLAGGAVPTAAVVVFYAARGELRVALDGFLVVNAEYTSQPSVFGNPGRILPMMWHGYHLGLAVLLAGLLVLLAQAVRALPEALRREPHAVALASVGAGALAGTVWTVLVVNGAPDLFELLPLGALGAASGVLLLARRLSRTGARRLVVVVAAVAVTVALVESVATRNTVLTRQRADVAAVLAAAPPGATVLSIDAPEVPALARLRNPLLHQVFDQRMRAYLDHTTPGGLTAYASYVARTRPTLVAIDPHRLHTWLDPVLATDYVRVGSAPEWDWYLLRSAGPDAIAAVRAANASVMGPGLDGQTSVLTGRALPVKRAFPRPAGEAPSHPPRRPAPGPGAPGRVVRP